MKLLAALLLVSVHASAQAAVADPSALLGLTLADAYEQLGVPARVYSLRGPEAGQDDVVFEFTQGIALFFYMDRVWQVRIAQPYAQPVMGFFVGSSPDRAVSVLGIPSRSEASAWEWALPASSYPVLLRALAGPDGMIAEIYVYRGDF